MFLGNRHGSPSFPVFIFIHFILLPYCNSWASSSVLMQVYRGEHHPCLFLDYRERAEYFTIIYNIGRASQVALVVKNLLANAGDLRDAVSVPRLGRCPGGGHSNPLQYFCLENPHEQRSLVGYSPYMSGSQKQY